MLWLMSLVFYLYRSEFFAENQKKMKLLIFLICESLAGLKSGAGNIKVQEECNVNIRKSRAKLTHVGTSSQDCISSILNIRGPWYRASSKRYNGVPAYNGMKNGNKILKARIPNMPKDEEYTGYLVWSKKDCSNDFLRKLDDGIIG